MPAYVGIFAVFVVGIVSVRDTPWAFLGLGGQRGSMYLSG